MTLRPGPRWQSSKDLEARVQRHALTIATLVELTDNLVDDVDHIDVMDLLMTLSDRCVSILDVDAAWVTPPDQAGQLQVLASSSDAMRILELFELQADEGPSVDCYRTGESITNGGLSAADGRWPSFTPRTLDAGFHSVHSLPMRVGRRTSAHSTCFGLPRGSLRMTRPEPPETGEMTLPWADMRPERAAQFARSSFVMATWSRDDLSKALDGVCEECAGPNWGVVMVRLSRCLDWKYDLEFDEYLDTHAALYSLPDHLSARCPGPWSSPAIRPPE